MRTKSIFEVSTFPDPPASTDTVPRETAPPLAAIHAANFFRASATASDALQDAVNGLCAIANAAVSGELSLCPAVERESLCATIQAAMNPIMVSAAERVSDDAVVLGLAAASGLVRDIAGPTSDGMSALNADRLDHLYILADKLDILVRRRRIDDRGDVLLRFVAASRARDVGPEGATKH